MAPIKINGLHIGLEVDTMSCYLRYIMSVNSKNNQTTSNYTCYNSSFHIT